MPRYSGTLVVRSMSQKPGSLAMSNKRSFGRPIRMALNLIENLPNELSSSPLLRSSYPEIWIKRVWIAAKHKFTVMVRRTTDHKLSRGE